MEETISTFAKARLFHSHTNQHLKILSKYILFWTFVSFIWQKEQQMEVMNLQTIWRNCGRGTLTQTPVEQNTVLCDVISSQANNSHVSSLPSTQKIRNLSEVFWTLCRLIFTSEIGTVTTFHLVGWATTLLHCWIISGVNKTHKATVGSCYCSLVETRLIKAKKMSSRCEIITLLSSVRNRQVSGGVEHVTPCTG